MNFYFLLKKLKKTFPWINRKPANETDCWQIVNRFKIVVRFAPLEVRGYYGKTVIRNKKRYYIFLDERLRGVELLRAFLHELGHALLHEPQSNLEVLYSRRETSFQTKQDFEADVFMLLAMLPFKRFLELKAMPEDELHPFTVEILKMREVLHEKIKDEDFRTLNHKGLLRI